jgi:hypothetical protein
MCCLLYVIDQFIVQLCLTGLLVLCSMCPGLGHLNVSGMGLHFQSKSNVRDVLRLLPSLVSFECRGARLTEFDLSVCAPSLRRLDASATQITDEQLQKVPALESFAAQNRCNI